MMKPVSLLFAIVLAAPAARLVNSVDVYAYRNGTLRECHATGQSEASCAAAITGNVGDTLIASGGSASASSEWGNTATTGYTTVLGTNTVVTIFGSSAFYDDVSVYLPTTRTGILQVTFFGGFQQQGTLVVCGQEFSRGSHTCQVPFLSGVPFELSLALTTMDREESGSFGSGFAGGVARIESLAVYDDQRDQEVTGYRYVAASGSKYVFVGAANEVPEPRTFAIVAGALLTFIARRATIRLDSLHRPARAIRIRAR